MVIRRRPALLILLGTLLLGLTLLLPVLRDAATAALLLWEIGHATEDRLFSRLRPEPLRETVSYTGVGRRMQADLYLPDGSDPHAALVLIHGVNDTGKDDPRMVWIARLLARAGFAVLVPNFLGLTSLTLRASDVEEIVVSFQYLVSRTDRVRGSRVGMVGFSYGAGPMLVAAAHGAIRDQVRFVLSVGGYYDLVHVITFVTTGYYEYEGQRFFSQPSEYDRWIFLRYNLDLVSSERDRRILGEIAQGKMRQASVEAGPLVRDLSLSARALYRLLAARHPEEVTEAVASLPVSLQREIRALSPSHVAEKIRAYAILVHSNPDPYVPHTETLRLAEAIRRQGQVHLGIVSLFNHVRPAFPPLTVSSLLRVYIPDGTRLFLLIYDLLRQQR